MLRFMASGKNPEFFRQMKLAFSQVSAVQLCFDGKFGIRISRKILVLLQLALFRKYSFTSVGTFLVILVLLQLALFSNFSFTSVGAF